jgi:hypothetical protein
MDTVFPDIPPFPGMVRDFAVLSRPGLTFDLARFPERALINGRYEA